jgi:hypothetical protein
MSLKVITQIYKTLTTNWKRKALDIVIGVWKHLESFGLQFYISPFLIHFV